MGGKPLARSTIYLMFTKPFYYGRFEYPKDSGMWYDGKHEPMITTAEYDRVQVLLGRDGNPRPRTHFDFAFTGVIRCGCGSMVTAEEKRQVICGSCRLKFAHGKRTACPRCKTDISEMTKPTLLHYTYYHCTKGLNRACVEKSVSAAELERQMEEGLSRIQISERFRDWALKYLREIHDKEVASRNDMIQSQQMAYRACLQRLDNLTKLKTSPANGDGSLLSDEEYGRQRLELLNEKRQIEELLGDAGERVEHWLKLSEQTFRFACDVRKRFASGNTQVKKAIISAIGSNLILKGNKLSISSQKTVPHPGKVQTFSFEEN